MLGLVGWGWLPAHPYSGGVAGTTVLSPLTLTPKRWEMWTVQDLMLWAPVVETLLNQMTLPGVMSWLPTSITGHPRLSVGAGLYVCCYWSDDF